MLGAHEELVARLGATGWQVTPVLAESLHTYDAPALVDEHREAVGDVVVVGLGTNDGQTPQQLGGWIDDLMASLRGVERVYWVNLPSFADWVPAANAEIAAAQDRWQHLRVIDWNARAAGDGTLRYADGIHLTAAGRGAMAELIAATLDTDTGAAVTTAPATAAPATVATTLPVTTQPSRALTITPNEGGGGDNTLAVVVLAAAGALGAGLLGIGWARRPRAPLARVSRMAVRPGLGLDRPGFRQRPRHRR
jgi:lysophospholipase L1-like esterase